MKILFYTFVLAFALTSKLSFAQPTDITGHQLSLEENENQGFVDIKQENNSFWEKFSGKKKDFYIFKTEDEDYAINPYFGIGYAFSIASFRDNGSSNYSKSVPTSFNSLYFLIGAKIGDSLLLEIGGQTGMPSTNGNNTASLNAVHLNVGWQLGEEFLGEYGDKNKIIILTGLVFGITSAKVDGAVIASNYFAVAPELGLAYQRFLTEKISIRFDARMSSTQIYQSQGAVMGTFMGTILFHL